MIPVVAIVGRPNTGKSTLFNKLMGAKHTITFDESGTTRDRVFGRVNINDYPMILVDTGGLEFSKDQSDIESDIKKQSLIAIHEADLIIFVVNAAEELTVNDYEVAKLLRDSDKEVILIASKCDTPTIEGDSMDLYELGFGEPAKISVIHNIGVNQFEAKLVKAVKEGGFKSGEEFKEVEDDSKVKISFVGKPNVGKSSLVNKLLGKERVIVSDVAGTTRDSVSLDFEYNEQEFILVDTAGFKKSGKLRGDWLEKFSVFRSLKAIEESDIAVLTIDASEGLTKQDMRISEYILESKKGLIIVLNKADLVKPETKNYLMRVIQHKMVYLHFAPLVFVSAKTGTNILQIFDLAIEIAKERVKEINTRELNYFLERTIGKHPPKPGIKIKFMQQVDIKPPTFVIFTNKPKDVHFSYRRYFENDLRKQFGFLGTAIEIKWKAK